MSGSRLKWIAIITMLIDHIGAAIIEHYIRYTDWAVKGMEARELFYNLDLLLRSIGRMAFPIFIFLLVPGGSPVQQQHQKRDFLDLFLSECILHPDTGISGNDDPREDT